jgi:hypothetical protein
VVVVVGVVVVVVVVVVVGTVVVVVVVGAVVVVVVVGAVVVVVVGAVVVVVVVGAVVVVVVGTGWHMTADTSRQKQQTRRHCNKAPAMTGGRRESDHGLRPFEHQFVCRKPRPRGRRKCDQ